MSRVCLGLVALLANLAPVHGADAKSPRTDLYGDPLPPGAVMRLGTIRLMHYAAELTFSKDGNQLISCDDDGEVRVWDAASGALLLRTQLGLRSGPRRITLVPGGAIAEATPWAVTKRETMHFYDTKTGKELGRLVGARMLAFSPDGKLLMVQWKNGNEWGPVRLWDIIGSKNHLTLEGPSHTTLLRGAFAPDGKQLAAFSDDKSDELFLWDAATGKLCKRKKFRAPMMSLAYASNGTTLAVGLYGKAEVALLNAADLKEKEALSASAGIKNPGFISRLTFSPDGRLLAGRYHGEYTSNENGVFLWDLSKPTAPRRLPAATAFAFAPDGKTLAYQDSNGREIFLWDVASGRQVQRRPGHDTAVEILAFSANGRLIASSAGCIPRNQLRLWDAATGAPLRALQSNDEWNNDCLFSPDSKCVISSGVKGTIQVWDVASGKELQRIDIDSERRRQGLQFNMQAACISADGKCLIAVVELLQNDLNQGRLLAWDLGTGKQLMQRLYRGRPVPEQHLERLDHAAFSPDGKLVTLWLGDRVGIQEIATKSLLAMLPKGESESIQFSPDVRFLKATTGPENLSLIEVASGEETVRLPIREYKKTAFTADGCALIEANSECLRVWDTFTGEQLHEMAWPQEMVSKNGGVSIWSLVVLPDGRAATGMTGGDILVWNLAPEKWPRPKPIKDLNRKELDALWLELASNARTAYRAVRKLTMSPAQTVSLLKDRLQAATSLDATRIEKLLADLDSDSFEKRESASRELIRMRYRVDAALQRALNAKPSLELRHCLEAILAQPKRPPAEALRTLRAIAVLESIGTPEARRLLEKLASGAASPETRAAQAALQRLQQRATWTKEGATP